MRRAGLALLIAATLLAPPAFAQDKQQTLADIKTELSALMAEFTALKGELVASGAAATGAAGGDALQRLDAIEAASARLTAQAAAVEIKVNRVISDGTNRLGDLEYRLCEVTEGCDPSTLPETPLLGGDPAADAPITEGSGDAPSDDPTAGVELAVGEKRDFDRASALMESGDFAGAAAGFASFVQTYPGSPLTQDAHYKRGEALAQAGDTAGSARAYLDAFTANEAGEFAPEALLKLGKALGSLGQTPDACLTLTEVSNRYPGSVQAEDATTAKAGLGCQ